MYVTSTEHDDGVRPSHAAGSLSAESVPADGPVSIAKVRSPPSASVPVRVIGRAVSSFVLRT